MQRVYTWSHSDTDCITWEQTIALRYQGLSSPACHQSQGLSRGIPSEITPTFHQTLAHAHLCAAGQARESLPMVPSHSDCVDGVILLLIVQCPAEGCTRPESLLTKVIICTQREPPS